jgi:hypothetical protein
MSIECLIMARGFEQESMPSISIVILLIQLRVTIDQASVEKIFIPG